MKQLFLFLAFLFLMGSCLKEPDFNTYSLDLVVEFGDDFPIDKKSGITVTLSNQQNSNKMQAATDAEGKIRFSSVEPGFYSAVVSQVVNQGVITYNCNAIKNIEVFGNTADVVKLEPLVLGAFVIKEFYYSGSVTPAGKSYYSDQYIELYNNTSEVQYADGISIFEHESSGTGVNIWAAIKDSIVAEMVWTIPGNGTQYPILPGKSIVIAQDAINHRDDPKGNPLSPVNLGNADFEFYVYNTGGKDIDSPAVPNMLDEYLSNNISEVVFRVQGGSALAIAKLPGKTSEERKDYLNKNRVAKLSASGSSTTYYPKIATKYIFDAVETVQDEAHAVYKRFTSQFDAGYTYVTTGSYSSKCVRRKIKEIISGRTVYQDTNNSTNDFLKDVDPKPKVYE
jgi:hypothetical protein